MGRVSRFRAVDDSPQGARQSRNPAQAVDYVSEWFRFPHVMPINPGADHLVHFRLNLLAAGVGANLVTDSHIAAVAMEYQAEVHSNDTDFSRFPGLRWRNPL